MRTDQLPPHPTATYVLPQHHTVYVSVPKAACTSLKWLVAGLQGEDPQQFHRSLSREVTRAMTIHRRGLWRHTPMLHQLDEAELAAVDPTGDWLVFAVVRHPAARLWSAWQSKFLLREPLWVERFGAQPWLEEVPTTSAQVVAAFHEFVEVLTSPGATVARDRHFMSQHELLGAGRTPYTRIYPTEGIPALLTDLDAQVRRHGYEGPALSLTRANETPLPMIAALFPSSVLTALADLYAPDFETYGMPTGSPRGVLDRDSYTETELAEVQRLVERAERIGDLAMSARERISRAKARAAVPPPPPPPPSMLTRVRRRAHRLRRRIGQG